MLGDKMKGVNQLILNEASMKEIVQKYLDEKLLDNTSKVTAVSESDNGKFLITTEEFIRISP
jgi:hypothetical protein